MKTIGTAHESVVGKGGTEGGGNGSANSGETAIAKSIGVKKRAMRLELKERIGGIIGEKKQ